MIPLNKTMQILDLTFSYFHQHFNPNEVKNTRKNKHIKENTHILIK